MSFEYKKQNWIPYGRKAFSLDINIKDRFNQTIDRLRLEKDKNIDNQRKLRKIKKYGFDLTFGEEIDIEEEKDKEIDWLE